ncbi:phenylacetate--CoA ligase family protein [Candidatus Hydrogenedentota bacterium]
MSFLGAIEDLAVGRITFSLTNYLYNRKGILKTCSQLMQSERHPQEILRELQLKRLKKVIEYAARWVPFYQNRFKDAGFQPGDLAKLEDLKGIPPLTRQDVVDHYTEMVDSRYAASITVADKSDREEGQPIPFAVFKKHKLVHNTSSGSTGAPTTFYEDGSVTAVNWALELRLRRWYGAKLGAREARMVCVSTDYDPDSRTNVMRRILWHQFMLPGVNIAEEEYAFCYDRLRKFKPKILWGFTPALAGLAEYVLEKGRDVSECAPIMAIGWASPLYDHERAVISKAFECHVTNVYGAREVGHVAAICPAGSFHINQEWLVVEIDEHSVCEDTEIGEILVTSLVNSPMPFIRYRMGDLGSLTDKQCACGRTLQVLASLLGRTGEIFVTKDGKMISPNLWGRTFMDAEINRAVDRFQVIYTREKDLRIKIVRRPNYSDAVESRLLKSIRTNFSSDTTIDFEYVPEIKPRVSGKYQMVVNETDS